MSTPPWGEEQAPPPPNPYGQQPGHQPGMPYPSYGGGPSPYVPGPTGYPTVPQTNGLAIASLCVSIASVVMCCGLPGIVGAILGHNARKQIRNTPHQTGDGLALGGIIVGWAGFALAVIGVAVWVVLIILGVAVGSSVDCTTDSDGYTSCS
jgi:hypothetical protein